MSTVLDPSAASTAAAIDPARDRRSRILDAAEACFARDGFHRTTMQDVAAECGMSQGNLYRYFPSKDAIVIGLTDRDRDEFIADFRLLESADNPISGLAEIGRKHLIEMPRARAALILEIWAEAARNPVIGDSCRRMEQAVSTMMARFVERSRQATGLGAGMPPAETITSLMMALGDGMIRRRATDPAFDAEPVFQHMLAMVAGAILASAVFPALTPSAPAQPPAGPRIRSL
jgi:TetR/AcrR family transcriptional regulator, repressor for uid operon